MQEERTRRMGRQLLRTAKSRLQHQRRFKQGEPEPRKKALTAEEIQRREDLAAIRAKQARQPKPHHSHRRAHS